MKVKTFFKDLKSHLPASIERFLVAFPLYAWGITQASGAPFFAGMIAGIASVSPLGVSGSAAGLAVILLIAETLGFWPVFLLAVVLASMMQLILALTKGLPPGLQTSVILSSPTPRQC